MAPGPGAPRRPLPDQHRLGRRAVGRRPDGEPRRGRAARPARALADPRARARRDFRLAVPRTAVHTSWRRVSERGLGAGGADLDARAAITRSSSSGRGLPRTWSQRGTARVVLANWVLSRPVDGRSSICSEARVEGLGSPGPDRPGGCPADRPRIPESGRQRRDQLPPCAGPSAGNGLRRRTEVRTQPFRGPAGVQADVRITPRRPTPSRARAVARRVRDASSPSRPTRCCARPISIVWDLSEAEDLVQDCLLVRGPEVAARPLDGASAGLRPEGAGQPRPRRFATPLPAAGRSSSTPTSSALETRADERSQPASSAASMPAQS